MAAEWLRAAQVADIAAAHHRGPRRPACAYCLDPWPCETAQLAAQDGRWRALVGELTPVLTAMLEYATVAPPHSGYWVRGHIADGDIQALRAWLALAQAALADMPPAPRGAAE